MTPSHSRVAEPGDAPTEGHTPHGDVQDRLTSDPYANSALLLERAATAIERARTLMVDSQRLIATSAELSAAITSRRGLAHVPQTELETQVRAYTCSLRAAGTAPEVALRLVKTALVPALESEIDGTYAEPALRRSVVDAVVRWFVETYYAA